MLEPMEDTDEPATVPRSLCSNGGDRNPLNKAVCSIRRGALYRSKKTQRREKCALPGRGLWAAWITVN